jgi:hypothetical protein
VLQQTRHRHFRRIRKGKGDEPSVVAILSWEPFPFPFVPAMTCECRFSLPQESRQEGFLPVPVLLLTRLAYLRAQSEEPGDQCPFLQHLWVIDAQRLAIVAQNAFHQMGR